MHQKARGYLIAIALSALAAAIRAVADEQIGDVGLFFNFYVATAAAAVIGGFGPGLVATFATGLAASLLFLPPLGSLWIERADHRALITAFFAIGVVTSVLGGRAQRARLRLAASLDAERQASARMQAVVEAEVDAIAIADGDGTIEFVNPALEQIFGYRRDELLGQHLKLLMPEPYRSEADDYLEAYRATRQRRMIGVGREVEGRRKEGATFPVHLSVSEVEVAGRRLFAGSMRDLSASKALEAQLLQAQKMEAVGTLAGGVAHDFNNLLTSILGSVELALAHPESRSLLTRSLERIKLAGNRGEALTKQLLAFSRKQVTRPELIDLNAALRQVRELFERMLGEDVDVKLDLHEGAGTVRIDPAQLDQVVINLVVNARDAMPAGGVLRLSTGRATLDAARATRLGLAVGEYATLSIQDEGEGISADVRARIFEPFFTTKEPGRGTGLGLSTVLGIVQRHGGAIDVRSEPGRGTTFEIFLPLVAEPAPHAGRPETRIEAPSCESGSILVVEDDPMMCDLLREVLERAGHRVLVAESPAAALELASSQSVDLLISDVIMPGMTGFDLAAKLRASGGRPRVIFMSGYTDQILADRGELGPDDAFMRKPFRMDELVSKVRAVLSRSEPGEPRARR